PPVVDTVQGQVLGEYVSLEGFAQPVAVFLGVPFAKPPLGPLRFAPPQPAEPWTFVKNATSYPPMSFPALLPICDLCGCFLPVQVMVWIHGGGLVVGGASTYDGLPLSAHENVVVVIIQYRLGLWGFFRQGSQCPAHLLLASQGGTGREGLTPLAAAAQDRPFSQEASHPHALPLFSQNFFHIDLHGDPRESPPFLSSVVDGVLLPKMPEELLAEKQLNSVPYIVGINQQEFGWMIPMNPNGEGLPHWPVYDQKEGYLQIGVPTQAAQKLKHEEVAFFTELLAQDTARMSPQTEHIEL
ncbi:PREDICTED: liver carboxylesterase 1-like, partial [Myotis brandtii]|uniref:liver carboxylesterase 1-like n=1 Tax=Myotis brandtii TaxID=109478 RepID=UPI00070445C0